MDLVLQWRFACSDKARAVTDLVRGTLLSVNARVIMGLALQWRLVKAELLWASLQWRSSQSMQVIMSLVKVMLCSDKARAVMDLVTGTLLSVNARVIMGRALQWQSRQSFYRPCCSDAPLSQGNGHYRPCITMTLSQSRAFTGLVTVTLLSVSARVIMGFVKLMLLSVNAVLIVGLVLQWRFALLKQ